MASICATSNNDTENADSEVLFALDLDCLNGMT